MMKTILILFLLLLSDLLSVTGHPVWAQAQTVWQIYLSENLAADDAIKVAVDDLQKEGERLGILFETADIESGHQILVGSAERNHKVKELVLSGQISLKGSGDEQGYEIITLTLDKKQVMVISGGSVIGEVYGLFRLLDRLRVFKKVPDINEIRVPAMKIRFTGGGANEEGLRDALRCNATWVSGGISVNHLVPWHSEPEAATNAKNREELKQLIDYAHRLHLKYLVYEDEFSYHPSLLEEFGATLSPQDPAFWDAVQAKYRRLFQAMPEIDGIRIRTGELTRVGGTYRPFDVMHDGECCDWSLEKRYRTFVKKLYNVAVGEFNKIYFQRTWVTSAYEQHSMAEVYKKIFTDDIPVENLYMSPYLSTTDRYFHQPYNPTFNLTPHHMILLLATLDYHSHAGVNTFPTFPGTYYQGGLETILSVKNSNIKGFDFGNYGPPSSDNWNTGAVTTYTIGRLAWNPYERMEDIARDFSAICFGQKAAPLMAEIYLLSPNAYKYGIYIEPVAYGDFRSLPQLRLTTFPAKGLPRLDHGKKHIQFLRTLYLRCRPWLNETLLYLDHGLGVAQDMVNRYKAVKPLIMNPVLAEKVEESVDLTYGLIKTNNLYVKTFFKYFEYRENPDLKNKTLLKKSVQDLSEMMISFKKMPGCVYRLDGMEQLVINVDQVLKDLPEAESLLNRAPDEEDIQSIISGLQQKYKELFNEYKSDFKKIVHWEARVDGRDLLKIKADQLEIEHLRYDPITEMSYKFENPLAASEVTVIPVDIQSRSYGPFILEQPTEKNDYTVTVYLSDYPRHGYSWWKLDLYYITRKPADLGLSVPWQNE